MSVTPDVQATLLLTCWLGRPQPGEPKPLGPAEWTRLSVWLNARKIEMAALLTQRDPAGLFNGWSDRTVTVERVTALLGRGGALGLLLERWHRAGLWVMTCANADYPSRLKARLGSAAPPVFFGCGHWPLLNRAGLAVVGSRDASEDDLVWTRQLTRGIASQGHVVISGGARGIDETAMLGALEAGGTAVGVLPDSLLRAATSAKYRNALMSKSLVLISSFSPESAFEVGNAMARNKYIYCMADAAIVAATGKDKGGTWTGALENLKHGWVPLWVKRDGSPHAGNQALVERGGRWMPEDRTKLAQQLTDQSPSFGVADLFQVYGEGNEPQSTSPAAIVNQPQPGSASLYEAFLAKVVAACATGAVTAGSLEASLDLTKSQLGPWLKRAVAEGRLVKLSKPVRYQLAQSSQRSFFL